MLPPSETETSAAPSFRWRGADLRRLRTRRGLTQQLVADAAGVARQRIGQLEGMAELSERDVVRVMTGLNRLDRQGRP